MADNKKIVFQSEFDTSKSVKGMKDMENQVNKTGKSVKNFGDKGKAGVDKVGSSVSNLKSPLQGASSGFGAVGASMKAMLANPVGVVITAIVGAFLALKKALTSTEEGQNKVAKATGVISTLFSKLFDLLEPIADFLFDVVIDAFNQLAEKVELAAVGLETILDFLGFTEAANSLANYTQELKDAGDAAALVADKRAEADRIERELIVERAKTEAKIAEARERSNDIENLSAEERAEALKEAGRLTDELAAKEEKRAKLLFDAIKLENSLTNSNKQDKEAQAQAEADLINIQTRRSNTQKALGRDLLRVNNEQKASVKARNKEIEEANKKALEERKKQLEEQIKAENEFYKVKDELLLTDQEKEIQAVNEKYDKKFEAIAGNAELEKELLRQQQEEINAIIEDDNNKKLQMEREQANKLAALRLELKELNSGSIDENSSPEEIQAYYNERRELANEEFLLQQEELAAQLESKKITKDEFDTQGLILEKKNSQKLKKIKDDEAAYEMKVEQIKADQKQALVSGVFNLATQLAGENAQAGKAIAIAQATVDTYKGAQAAFASAAANPQTILFPGYPAVMAGIAVASGLANVKKILSTKTPGGGGSGGGFPGLPSGGGASSPTPPPLPDLIGAGGEQDVTTVGGEQGARQNTIKAVVVETDITNTQDKIKSIEETSTLN